MLFYSNLKKKTLLYRGKPRGFFGNCVMFNNREVKKVETYSIVGAFWNFESLFKERNLLKNNFDEMNYEYIFFKGKDEKTAAMPTILFRYLVK